MKKKSNVWWLGITSLLTDISSEMLFPIIPIFLKVVLGANMFIIGIIEGVASVTAALMKFASGWYSDKKNKRKPFAILGYTLSTLTKPVLALTATWTGVLGVRVVDRIGKGIRTSPRDALIADSVDKSEYGRAFGIHRMLDTVGAIIGTIIAAALLWYLGSTEVVFRKIFWLSAIPGVLGVVALWWYVKEVKPTTSEKPITFSWKNLSPTYKRVLITLTIFQLGQFSYAFFLLRAKDLVPSLALIPLLYLLMNFFYAGTSIVAGKAADKVGCKPVLFAGLLLYALVSLGFAHGVFVWGLFAFYGIFLGIFDAVAKALVSGIAGKAKASGIGLFDMCSGLVLLPANVLGGLIWKVYGSSVAFSAAAIVSVAAAVAFVVFVRSPTMGTRSGIKRFRFYR